VALAQSPQTIRQMDRLSYSSDEAETIGKAMAHH
jgi:hypothetical protein